MTYESVTAEMIQALSDEITEIKEGARGKQVPLRNGLRVGFIAGNYLYTFDAASELAIPDDTPAQLRIGEQSHQVTIVGIDGFEITLSIREDIGLRVPSATLNTSPWYLLEILKTRLEESTSGKLAVNREMSLRVFNGLPNLKVSSPPTPDFTKPLRLNHITSANGGLRLS